jgi:hypothetical protein
MKNKFTFLTAAVVLAIMAGLTPRAFAQTYDKAHASAIILAGSGTDPVNTLSISVGSVTGNPTITLPGANAIGVLTNPGTGILTWSTLGAGSITPGAANQFLVTNSTPAAVWQGLNINSTDLTGNGIGTALDIAATYPGGSSIATVGTITTGAWHCTPIAPTYGGTGLANPTAHGILVGEGSSNVNPIVLSAGQILIGTTSGDPSAATITGTTSQVNVTNATGSITLSTPQNIALTSAPTFAGMTLTNTTNQLTLGTTNTVTISSAAPSASRTYSIADMGANASFALTTGTPVDGALPRWSGTAGNLTNSSVDDNGVNVSSNENLVLSGAGKQLSFLGTGVGAGTSTFQAGAQSTNTYNYTLPVTTPSANQVLTATAVSGATPYAVTLAWASPIGAVSSVTATNSTLTISPTTGAVLAGLNLANPNTWTATQTHNNTTTAAAPLVASNTFAASSGTVLGATIATTGSSTGITNNTALQLTASGSAGTNTALSVTAGLVNIAGLTASLPVFTDASKNLTNTGIVPSTDGGTGVNNAFNITLGGAITTAGAFITSGANSLTLTTTGATNVTLPTSGTLATTGNSVASFSAGSTGLTPNTATTGAVILGGTLVPGNGGTGLATITAHGVMIGEGTSNVAPTAAGGANTVLSGNGASSDPTFVTLGTNATLLGNGIGTSFGINLTNANTWTATQTHSNTTTAAAPLVASNTSTPAAGTVLGETISVTGVSTGSAGNVALQLTTSGSTGTAGNTDILGTSSNWSVSSLGALTLGKAGTTGGSIALGSGLAAFSTTIQNSATTPTANYTYLLPAQTAAPTAGQVLSITSVSGSSPSYTATLGWSGGASGSVNYNTSSAQNTATTTNDLFNVAYAAASGATAADAGAVITSNASGATAGTATGLTITATGSGAGTTTGLSVAASGGTTNTAIAVTGTGLVNIAGLTASSPVFTDASKNLTSTGIVPVADGGAGVSLATTGGASQVLKQTSVGGTITVAQLTQADISGLTTASSPTFNALTLTNPLAVASGGTGVATATANFVFAGPVSGVAAAPGFRALVAADLPASSGNYIQNGTTAQTSASFNIASASSPALTAAFTESAISNLATNTTVNAAKTGLAITSTGTWTGAGAGTNTGLTFNVANGTTNTDIAGTSVWSITSAGAGTFGALTSSSAPATGVADLNVTNTALVASDIGEKITVSGAGTANTGLTFAVTGGTASNTDITGSAGWSVSSLGAGTFSGVTTGSAVLTSSSPSVLSASTSDWALSATNSYFKVSASSAVTLYGIAGGVDGRVIIILNNGTTNAITFSSEDATDATAANRIHLAGGAGNTLILAPDGFATLIYDSGISRWRVLSSK